MTALRTGEHILRWITPARERKTSRLLRAACSCGGRRWTGVPTEATMRVLHEIHVAQASCEHDYSDGDVCSGCDMLRPMEAGS